MGPETDIIPSDYIAEEVTMADFRCLYGGHRLQVSHSNEAKAVKGLVRCSCGTWNPVAIEENLVQIVGDVSMPVRTCPKCKAKAAFKRRWEWPPNGEEVSALDSCSACGFTGYFQSSDRAGHTVIEQYPVVIMEAPVELPPSVKRAYTEALRCYGANAPNGALLMCRRAIQEALDNLGARKGDLPTQLQDLVTKYEITPDLKEWADHARIGGKLAGHGTGGAEWGDPTKTWGEKEDAEAVIEFCEAFFEHVYIVRERNKQRRKKIAPLPEAQSQTGDNAP